MSRPGDSGQAWTGRRGAPQPRRRPVRVRSKHRCVRALAHAMNLIACDDPGPIGWGKVFPVACAGI